MREEVEKLLFNYKQDVEEIKNSISYKETYNVTKVQLLIKVISDLEKILKRG